MIAIQTKGMPPLTGIALSLCVWGCGGSSSPPSQADASIAESDGGCGPNAGCAMGLTCCSGQCVNLANDPHNCGACGLMCSGAAAYCQGQCTAAPCALEAGACGANSCCTDQCCGQGQLCCLSGAGPPIPACYSLKPGETTCPLGCALCQ